MSDEQPGSPRIASVEPLTRAGRRLTEAERSHDDNRHILSAIDMPERWLALAMVAFFPAFAIIGLIAATSDEGPHSHTRLVIALTAIATTVPVVLMVRRIQFGTAWIERHGRRAGPASIFCLYADIGVAVVLFTFVDHEAALFGAILLATVSVFVAHFDSMPVVIAHTVFASALIVTLAVLAWHQGEHDTPAIVARALVALLVVNGTVGVTRRMSVVIQTSFQAQFVQANRDPLTGLLNRRGFEDWAAMLLADSPAAAGFVILDVDNFKAVNDQHGHAVGDGVLRLLAGRIEQVIGFTASAVARSGGEEFAIAVAADYEELTALAEAIRLAAHDPQDRVPITVSIGVATGAARYRLRERDRVGEEEAMSHGLAVADTAMYAAKAAGRDRVVTLDYADIPAASTQRPTAQVRDIRAATRAADQHRR